ncbi:MAG TPA: protein-glutamate O-methyltransferase CheR, partial [Pirellulales bacterium]|nr:protein-glutamate O-methyltransferase CheR [Pirellulales bacterium]
MSLASQPNANLVDDPYYARLKDHVIAATGLAYYNDRDDDLSAHFERRLTELALADCGAYYTLLLSGAEGVVELDRLIEELTIGETFFFRHRELFDALRDQVLPAAIRRNRASRRLRIWSAGCSFGAEPYSLSILLKRDLAHLVHGWDISILATDVNRRFLDAARRGQFEDWAFRGVPAELREECFRSTGKRWSIAPQLREGVSFHYHNLVEQTFPSLAHNLFGFDLILCRNVMIYFGKDVVRRLITQFHDSLNPEGWLLVGHVEPNPELYRAFQTLNASGAVLYQKPPARQSLTAPPEPDRKPAADLCTAPLKNQPASAS